MLQLNKLGEIKHSCFLRCVSPRSSNLDLLPIACLCYLYYFLLYPRHCIFSFHASSTYLCLPALDPSTDPFIFPFLCRHQGSTLQSFFLLCCILFFLLVVPAQFLNFYDIYNILSLYSLLRYEFNLLVLYSLSATFFNPYIILTIFFSNVFSFSCSKYRFCTIICYRFDCYSVYSHFCVPVHDFTFHNAVEFIVSFVSLLYSANNFKVSVTFTFNLYSQVFAFS